MIVFIWHLNFVSGFIESLKRRCNRQEALESLFCLIDDRLFVHFLPESNRKVCPGALSIFFNLERDLNNFFVHSVLARPFQIILTIKGVRLAFL